MLSVMNLTVRIDPGEDTEIYLGNAFATAALSSFVSKPNGPGLLL